MIQRPVPPRPASPLIVLWTGLYEGGWSASAASQPPIMTTGDSAADATAHPRTAGLELAGRAPHGIRVMGSLPSLVSAGRVSSRLCRLGGRGGCRLCRLGGRGGCRLLGAGEVGAADPDRGDVDGQGEQRDGGGGAERA